MSAEKLEQLMEDNHIERNDGGERVYHDYHVKLIAEAYHKERVEAISDEKMDIKFKWMANNYNGEFVPYYLGLQSGYKLFKQLLIKEQ